MAPAQTIRIAGTGSYVPEKVLSNDDIKNLGLDTSHEWIVQRTGIHERRVASADQAASDLGLIAAQRALAAAGLEAADVDLIVVPTVTPDTCCPAAANWLEAKLGAERAVSFDISAACSGFVFGMDLAAQYLKSGTFGNALVVAAEVITRTVNWKDRRTCILWGDGAGAAVLTADGRNGPQLLSTHIHSDGSRGQNLLVPGGGSTTTPITHESVDAGVHFLNLIEANYTFKVAVRSFVAAIREGADANGVEIDQIDWFIPHQANLRMFHAMAQNLKIPIEKFYVTIERYGNISSASCAISLDEAVRDGSVRTGDLVCMPVFGGGLTWGSAMIRW